MPAIRRQLSGEGGRHHFLALPAGAHVGNRTDWRRGIDIRAAGGYVIAAPSVHITGGDYRWLN